jgi:hypothetical protein
LESIIELLEHRRFKEPYNIWVEENAAAGKYNWGIRFWETVQTQGNVSKLVSFRMTPVFPAQTDDPQ